MLKSAEKNLNREVNDSSTYGVRYCFETLIAILVFFSVSVFLSLYCNHDTLCNVFLASHFF